MSLGTTFRLFLRAVLSSASPYGGGGNAEVNVDTFLANGTSANQANKVHQSTTTLASSGTTNHDFTTLTGPDGAAIAAAEIVYLIIEADAGNSDSIQVKPSASNGWTGLQSGTTDHIKIQPGTFIALGCKADGKYPVTASNKSILVTNSSSSATAKYTLTVVARNA